MKALILGGLISVVGAFALSAQTPAEISPTPAPNIPPPSTLAPAPVASVAQAPMTSVAPAPVASIAPVAAPIVSATPVVTATTPNDFADSIKRKAHGKSKHGFTIDLGDDDDSPSAHRSHRDGDIPKAVVPIVVISMLGVFGFPVAIVALILFSSWAKNRSLHRTVREMVAKGQPVPPELLASRAGAPLRPWYDLRRGIILLAVGVSIIFFFGAVAGWDAGVWAIGLIPAIIGTGYILTWRLAQKQENGLKL